MAAEEAQLKVCRVSTVVPAIPTVRHRMFLSIFDLYSVASNNMRFLLFYKPTASTTEKEFCVIVENLKRSLSLVLVDFYPFAGRLQLKGRESGRPEIDCNDGGVDFVEASTDMTFQDVETNDFQHTNFFQQLVPTRNQNYEAPLLSIQCKTDISRLVQVTGFLGGGICVGIRLHHVIADGKSFSHFMECWAEQSRGIPVSKRPRHMRTVFKREKQNHISLTSKQVLTHLSKEAHVSSFSRDNLLPVKYAGSTRNASEENMKYAGGTGNASEENMKYAGSTRNASEENISTIHKSTREETKLEVSAFHFSEKMIKKLKQQSGTLSSFIAVAAQFWRCIMKAREVPEEERVAFKVVAECRGRVKPHLPPTYFGNCVSFGYAQTSAKELLDQDIRFAARLIQEIINSCTTEEYIDNQVDWYESQLSTRGHFTTENLSGVRYIVHTISSPKFGLYEIDHGWGSPLSVQDAFMDTSNMIGGLFLFAGREGGIIVSTQLPHHQMETLKQILMIIPDYPRSNNRSLL
eukprot:PITA_30859